MSRIQPGRLWLLTGAAALVLFALAGFAAPDLASAPTLCLLRRVSGVPCPACGLTRACGWLARGDLRDALALHPLAPLVLLEAGVAWLWWGAVLRGWTHWGSRRFGMAVLWANIALLLTTWVARLATGTLP